MAAKASPHSSSASVKVKKEVCSDDIKEFAETAMNELLGWYGYEKVDRGEILKTSNRPNLTISMTSRRKAVDHSTNDSSCSNGAPGHVETSISDHDSSRESSKSPSLVLKPADKIESDCTWCRRTISPNSTEVIGSPDGPIFCTESCFAQSRRASFKRAKTCDWCRHVRHAVSYVDFQDGASQLQFCSDKCLNQYKMQIFCKETQAHLDMNPHLKDKVGSTSGALITPELWMKNCKSRSATPTSERSRSRSLSPRSTMTSVSPNIPTSIPTPNITIECGKKPLISVAPASKLLSKSLQLPPGPRQGVARMFKRRRSQRHLGQDPHMDPGLNNNNNNNVTKICLPTNAQDLRVQRMHVPEQVQLPRPPSHHQFLPPPPNLFPLRGAVPRGPRFPPQGHPPPPMQDIPHQLPPRFPSSFGLPPVTVLVPYPIILPLPIPIPIPIPILKPHPKEPEAAPKPEQPATPADAPKDEEDAQPIDYTKAPRTPPLSPEKTATEASPEASPSSSQQQQQPAESEAEQKLPKFKITRLTSKRSVVSNKEIERSESSRPLRKRKCLLASEQHQIVELENSSSRRKS